MIPLFDLTRQYMRIRGEILNAIDRVISSGRVILGENVKKLEEKVASFVGVKHGIGVASGSDALLIALRAMGVEKGDVVVTTPYTFFATASAPYRLGARVIFVDVEESTFNMDPNQLEHVLKKEKVKAVIPVHLFGRTMDLEALSFLKEKYGVMILEDCAQSFGSEWKFKNGEIKKSGSVGDAAIFSFFPTKNLGTYGDGGMIVTNSEKIAEECRMLRVHGARKKYFHEKVGYNSRLDEIHAAVLSVKFRYLEKWTEERLRAAKTYQRLFEEKGLPVIYPRVEEKGFKYHVFHQYVVLFENEETRDRMREGLSEREIQTAVYYPLPLHLQKCFKGLGYREGDFPVAESLSKRSLALPIFPELRDEEIEEVVSTMELFV
ncbi:DegT/DnrJ/EryC1/StrS aminotransferase family protein [Thermotoga sp.]|uniref:DegT/DnrJ/EryC1/StrS family aminotransferase n=1 Tax=Thermotoga sp. TaxID=28240 RepID=UPI0025E1240C|nr:DegT/DnrJ/EryC1/StrS family aminotransferase [Thermotoga sp.]MCD6551842.1 DegT/DnrJ/EryC1/StrS family aminotransferase [Thermotoga sp.]